MITSQPASTTVNVGRPATFTVQVGIAGPVAYQWNRNGLAIPGATGASYMTPNTSVADHLTSFNVTVTTAAGPIASASATLSIATDVWAGIRQDGSPSPGSIDISRAGAIATDRDGNVLIAGIAAGTVAGSSFPGDREDRISDAFVAKYSRAGVLLWARRAATSGSANTVPEHAGVAADALGNVYVTGRIIAGRTLPGQISAGGADVTVHKYSPDGELIWGRQFGSDKGDEGLAIAVDPAGNVTVVGVAGGQMPLQPLGQNGYFIARFDTDGNRLWVRQSGTSGATSERAVGIALDAAGNAYLVGSVDGNGLGTVISRYDAFVAKYDTLGERVWLSRIGTRGSDFARAIAVSADGSAVYIGGNANGDFDVPGFPQHDRPCCIRPDAFVVRLDGNGVLQWGRNLRSVTQAGPTYFSDEANGIATDATGSAVFLAGSTTGVMPDETSKGGQDIVVARYAADGSRTWVRQFGAGLPATGTRNDAAHAVTLDAAGDVFVAGETLGTFGSPGRDTNRPNWFVLKLRPGDGTPYE